jgi:hypothetical protein
MKTEEIRNYNVSRYFDDVLEAVVAKDLTEEEARKKARELNDMKPRAYVEYLIRRTPSE